MSQLPDWVPFAFGFGMIVFALVVFAGILVFLALDEDDIRSKAKR